MPNVCATSLTENQRFQTDNIHTIDTSHHHTVNHQNEKTNIYRINKSKSINHRNNNYELETEQQQQLHHQHHRNGDVSYEPNTIDKENIYNKHSEYLHHLFEWVSHINYDYF